MAFKKIESTSSGSIPFFKEYVKELNQEMIDFLDEKLMTPKFIKHVSSGKGFMINFDDEFMIFVWNKSSTGSAIKKMIGSESGCLMMIQFKKTKKGLDYEIGFDDEIEVAIEEDKFEEGIYFLEVTNGDLPPIAPDDHRKFLSFLPILHEPKPVTFPATKKPKPSTKPRSDGEG